MWFPLHTSCIVTLLVVLGPFAHAEGGKTAAELVVAAHKHDNMYTTGPGASQTKALVFYESALAAEPNEKQRLHILYRMGQLYGSSYDLSKGEKPNFDKAVNIYKQIIESYPPEEPLVFKAMSSLCDHYTTLRDFHSAVAWAKKMLDYDTSKMAGDEQAQGRSLKETQAEIRFYQEIAVDQVAYSANLIGPLWAHGELRTIIDKYEGTFIAERAGERLSENMDNMADVWAPELDNFPGSDNDSIESHVPGASAISRNQKHDGSGTQIGIVSQTPQQGNRGGYDSTAKQQKDQHVERQPRAPPRGAVVRYVIIAASVVVLGFAAYLLMKSRLFLRA